MYTPYDGGRPMVATRQSNATTWAIEVRNQGVLVVKAFNSETMHGALVAKNGVLVVDTTMILCDQGT